MALYYNSEYLKDLNENGFYVERYDYYERDYRYHFAWWYGKKLFLLIYLPDDSNEHNLTIIDNYKRELDNDWEQHDTIEEKILFDWEEVPYETKLVYKINWQIKKVPYDKDIEDFLEANLITYIYSTAVNLNWHELLLDNLLI